MVISLPKLVCLIPLGVGGLVVDVGSNISDLVVIETTTECGHGVLSVGHLHELHSRYFVIKLMIHLSHPTSDDKIFLIVRITGESRNCSYLVDDG